ncbi:MAG: GNAT family N-acetyltransferase [Candidatus Lokiarchaeota archaeon]|nr:GNAT family N-acetyltransferase [Candidatus Lokiarchaeota archaeon]
MKMNNDLDNLPKLTPDYVEKAPMFELNNFYRLSNKDIKKATEVYARAYSKITLYEKALEDVEDKSLVLKLFFEIPIRFGLKYGFLYASSEQLEGISIWIPYEKADMNMWRMIRSGGFKNTFKLAKSGKKFLASVKGFSQLDKDRHKNMAGKQYLHLMSLAVDPEYQRKGIASKLLEVMFEKTDICGYSIYVSADIDNVDFYKKHGFKVIKEVNIKIKNYDLANWEMVRNPNKTT